MQFIQSVRDGIQRHIDKNYGGSLNQFCKSHKIAQAGNPILTDYFPTISKAGSGPPFFVGCGFFILFYSQKKNYLVAKNYLTYFSRENRNEAIGGEERAAKKQEGEERVRAHKKFIDHAGVKYLFSIGPSVFTTRNGLFDLRFARKGSWGAREDDGNLYTTIRRLSVESKSVLCDYGHIPAEVIGAGLDFLRTFKHELNTDNHL